MDFFFCKIGPRTAIVIYLFVMAEHVRVHRINVRCSCHSPRKCDYLLFFFFAAFLSLNEVILSFETVPEAVGGVAALSVVVPRPFVFCSPCFFIRIQ
jgi:hypothetical protein